MAAATFKVHTVLHEAKVIIEDFANGLGNAGDWLSDDEYNSILLKHIALTSEATYTLTKRTTGIYTYDGGAVNLYLSNQVTPFTGDSDVTYTVCARGLTVLSVTSGGTVQVDHSSSTIDIVGIELNFNAYVAELFGYLKSQKSTKIDQSIDSASFSMGQVIASLDESIAYWQGVSTSAN